MKNNDANPTDAMSAADVFEVIEANEGDVNLHESRQGCISVQLPNDDETDA